VAAVIGIIAGAIAFTGVYWAVRSVGSRHRAGRS
jgi:hypothetical protein